MLLGDKSAAGHMVAGHFMPKTAPKDCDMTTTFLTAGGYLSPPFLALTAWARRSNAQEQDLVVAKVTAPRFARADLRRRRGGGRRQNSADVAEAKRTNLVQFMAT